MTKKAGRAKAEELEKGVPGHRDSRQPKTSGGRKKSLLILEELLISERGNSRCAGLDAACN